MATKTSDIKIIGPLIIYLLLESDNAGLRRTILHDLFRFSEYFWLIMAVFWSSIILHYPPRVSSRALKISLVYLCTYVESVNVFRFRLPNNMVNFSQRDFTKFSSADLMTWQHFFFFSFFSLLLARELQLIWQIACSMLDVRWLEDLLVVDLLG